MAWKLEGRDLVINGFDGGIADSPFKGIADMRNVETGSYPEEASVQFGLTSATVPPALNDIAYTASASTNRLTWAGPNTLYEGCAIKLTPANVTITYLVLAGGGGGGGDRAAPGGEGGGGGGAGGFKNTTMAFSSALGTYAITVGAGGAAGSSLGGAGGDGGDSSIAALVVSTGGGGGGGPISTNGRNGGSGGGASAVQGGSSGTAGTGSAGQGNNGGTGAVAGVASGGGGGGAGAVGSNASGSTAGNGGSGTASSITGASVTYGGGGGGGGNTAGTGGSGGGGNGNNGGNGTAGTANLGGGGGGAYGGNFTGGAGGSGKVVISYPTGALNATGGVITTSGGNTIHTFDSSGDFVVTGLEPDKVYYVRNIVGNTFQLSESVQGSIFDITEDASGTFTTYQYGNQRGVTALSPITYWVDRGFNMNSSNYVYFIDGSGYAWALIPDGSGDIPANSLIFLGNIGGSGATSGSTRGIAIWKGYIIVWYGSFLTDIADLSEIWNGDGPADTWIYGWEAVTMSQSNGRVATLASADDDNVYWISSNGLGSIIEEPGETFDPTDTDTYNITSTAILIPTLDKPTCLAELGAYLLIGGQNSFVYTWDKISPGFNSIIQCPEHYISFIVATNQNAYILAGVKGNIYLTNGSGMSLYKKVPDYLTGAVNPYIRFWDASFGRKQLFFTFTSTTNADVDLAATAGAWAIDTNTNALRMWNKITNSGYAGIVPMAAIVPQTSQADGLAGSGLVEGWTVSGVYGIDVGTSTPYSNYETFIDTELIPVGTFIAPFTPSQVEWKASAPLVSGEAVRLYFRTNITESFTLIGESSTAGAFSDMFQTNFQKAQWVQFRIQYKSTATTPSYTRLTEMRLRDFLPEGS